MNIWSGSGCCHFKKYLSSWLGPAPNVLHTIGSTALVPRMLAWCISFHESSPSVPLDWITQLLLQLNFTSCLTSYEKSLLLRNLDYVCSVHMVMKQIVGIRLQSKQETAELMAVVLTVVWSPIQAVLTRVWIKFYNRGDQILKRSAAPADDKAFGS